MKRLPKFERQLVGDERAARKPARIIGNLLIGLAEHMAPGARAGMQDLSDDEVACSLLELWKTGYLGVFQGVDGGGEERMALIPCLNGEPIVELPYSCEQITLSDAIKNKPSADQAEGLVRMPRAAAGPRSSIPTVNGAKDED